MSGAAGVPGTPVALSTSSVKNRTPGATGDRRLTGLGARSRVMVFSDPVGWTADALRPNSAPHHQLPLPSWPCARRACTALPQRVWGREPWEEKVRRAKDLAERVGAPVVVVHPPFRWRRVLRARLRRRAWPSWPPGLMSSSRWRTWYPLRVRSIGEVAPYSALGPDRVRRPARHAGPVAHRRLGLGRPGHGRRARRPPGPRAPGRRHSGVAHRPRFPTSTWCPGGAASRALSCSPCCLRPGARARW